MGIQYRISCFTGPANMLERILEKLIKEVTYNINQGAELAGGVNIAYHDAGVTVSQALTYVVV